MLEHLKLVLYNSHTAGGASPPQNIAPTGSFCVLQHLPFGQAEQQGQGHAIAHLKRYVIAWHDGGGSDRVETLNSRLWARRLQRMERNAATDAVLCVMLVLVMLRCRKRDAHPFDVA